MNVEQKKATVAVAIKAIRELDLDPIKLKLMDKEEGRGWSREYADRMETEYKRFLTLALKYPDEPFSPGKELDAFWHAHILDTLRYGDDCNRIFGRFLHHFPYLGMRGAEDVANRDAAAANLRRLYQQEFGGAQAGPNPDAPSYCASADGAAAAKVMEQASYCAIATASYCARADGTVAAEAMDQASYCAIATASYCARADKTATTTATGHASDKIRRPEDILDVTRRPTLAAIRQK